MVKEGIIFPNLILPTYLYLWQLEIWNFKFALFRLLPVIMDHTEENHKNNVR